MYYCYYFHTHKNNKSLNKPRGRPRDSTLQNDFTFLTSFVKFALPFITTREPITLIYRTHD